jgi:hypothetical protein
MFASINRLRISDLDFIEPAAQASTAPLPPRSLPPFQLKGNEKL